MGFFLNSIPRETTRVSVQCLDIAGKNRTLKNPQKHSLSALILHTTLFEKLTDTA